MEIDYIFEKAKDLLQKDKRLTPVLFVETEEGVSVIGLIVDLGKVDKREMMENLGRDFAIKKQIIQSVSIVSDIYISRVKPGKDKNGPPLERMERREAILVAKMYLNKNKNEIIVQHYERSGDNITFSDSYRESEVKDAPLFLLDDFIKEYRRVFNMDMN